MTAARADEPGPAGAAGAAGLSGLVATVRRRLAEDGGPVTGERVSAALRDSGRVLGSTALAELDGVVRAEIVGAGPLQPFLDDPAVTDVLVNGPRDVWVERGGRLRPVAVDLGDAARVRELAVRLAAAAGQRLDDARPAADARLPDGTRLHAVLPPVADGCTLLSLRVVRHRPFTLDDLVRSGTVAPGVDQVLRALVRSRANLLVSGATGTGKTTLLSTLLSLADPDERIICVEEAGELAPRHPHVVRLLARRPNVEGAGGVDLADLVRESLRMRPDRVVLGECRGAEVREVLGALNTGHDGGCRRTAKLSCCPARCPGRKFKSALCSRSMSQCRLGRWSASGFGAPRLSSCASNLSLSEERKERESHSLTKARPLVGISRVKNLLRPAQDALAGVELVRRTHPARLRIGHLKPRPSSVSGAGIGSEREHRRVVGISAPPWCARQLWR